MSFDFYDLVTSVIKLVSISAIVDDLDSAKTRDEQIKRNISHAGAPGDGRFLQPIWDLRLLHEDFIASPLFPVVLSVTFYFSICTPFMICDLWGKNWKWIQKYKIQSNLEVSPSQVRDTLVLTFWNHVLYILPAAVGQWVWTPPTHLPELAPSVAEFVWHQFAGLIVFDFQYFVWHWTHHRIRFLYKHVHAVHHRYAAPFCWTTQYLHPWELVTVGFLTTTNTWFFKCHPLTVWSYMLLSIVISVEAHIGFDFPFTLNHLLPFTAIGGAPKHDMHHLKPYTNFQPFFNHWDKFFDTFCPAMEAGGVKPKDLQDYERKQRETKKCR